jgi:hypothetical protein
MTEEYQKSMMKQDTKPNDKTYRLNGGIRVRKEVFGLLFYNARIPQLIFVHSGEWFFLLP